MYDLEKKVTKGEVENIKLAFDLGRQYQVDKLIKELRGTRFAEEEKECGECGSKLTLPDEIKYGICRGCGSSAGSGDFE